MFEIERKFLLTAKEAKEWQFFGEKTKAKTQSIAQAYLMVEGKSVWRVRVYEDAEGASAVWTFKKGTSDPRVRVEEEAAMPVEQAKRLVASSERVIKKSRTKIHANGHCFELDVFSDEHQGLVLLEIELPEAGTPIHWPDGLPTGLDVTAEAAYRNDTLAQKTESIRMAQAAHITPPNFKRKVP